MNKANTQLSCVFRWVPGLALAGLLLVSCLDAVACSCRPHFGSAKHNVATNAFAADAVFLAVGSPAEDHTLAVLNWWKGAIWWSRMDLSL